MAAVLDIRMERFQVSAQSNFKFGSKCHLQNFKVATMAAILDIGMELLNNSKFPWQPSWISERNEFCNSESP